MATIYRKKNRGGSCGWQIQFQIPHSGKIKTITLPSAFPKGNAEKVKALTEKLADSIRYETELDARTKREIEEIPPFIRKKLENAGLLEPSKRVTAFQLWDKFTDDPDGRKDSTILTYTGAQGRFFSFFKKDSDPNAITVEDGKNFRKWMVKKGYAEATIAATISKIRTVFKWGMEEGFLRENIFLKVQRGSYENKNREHFITPEDYLAILDACPNQEWRVFISLMRIGGLRWGEAIEMKWVDLNWEKGLMRVNSPKTAHHVGHDYRLVPLWPELREELEELDSITEPGEVYILGSLHGESSQNLRKVFKNRIIFQAGLEPWERLFHNLRGSRANEIWNDFPPHLAGSWMGQSYKVAMKHYLNIQRPNIIQTALTYSTVKPTKTSTTDANYANRVNSATGANETEVIPTESGGFTPLGAQDQSVFHKASILSNPTLSTGR